MFKAILVDNKNNNYTSDYTNCNESALPKGNVTVDIAYSSLNYKDALALSGQAPIIKNFPLVPGIDFSGIVAASEHPDFKKGDSVILNGWGVGEKYWGGFSQKARVNGDWLIHKPDGISLEQTMSIGTAGYTAMLCIMALLKQGVKPENGDIIVSGATGGVGTIAIHLLAKLGYNVFAITGKPHEADMLKAVGAKDIIGRDDFSRKSKPLEKERWAGAIDVVGGETLATLCASMRYGGTVVACGLAGGMDFLATVAPFILRGIKLIGIDSVMCPKEKRIEAWENLAKMIDGDFLANNTTHITLSQTQEKAYAMLKGQLTGRVVIDVNG